MKIANSLFYLDDLMSELQKQWPDNRTINIVCHGHSVPAGYYATPFVDTFHSYPYMLHRIIKERFPFACLNVIVTAIGGENAVSGSQRFCTDVLCHRPDIITIDYGLNDRTAGLEAAKQGWSQMIEKALEQNSKVLLLTPTWDKSFFLQDENWQLLVRHAEQIRALAEQYHVGLSDSFAAFQNAVSNPHNLSNLLSHSNHPNRKGHELIVTELAKWFTAK